MVRGMWRAAAASFLAVLGLASPASADWQDTRWGMSLEEVLSTGATATTPAERKGRRVEVLGEALAKRPYAANGFDFEGTFYFDRGKLSAVRLTPRRPDEVTKIGAHLSLVYGKPVADIERPETPGCRMSRREWRDHSAGNVVTFFALRCMDPAMPTLAGVDYQPILAKGRGL